MTDMIKTRDTDLSDTPMGETEEDRSLPPAPITLTLGPVRFEKDDEKTKSREPEFGEHEDEAVGKSGMSISPAVVSLTLLCAGVALSLAVFMYVFDFYSESLSRYAKTYSEEISSCDGVYDAVRFASSCMPASLTFAVLTMLLSLSVFSSPMIYSLSFVRGILDGAAISTVISFYGETGYSRLLLAEILLLTVSFLTHAAMLSLGALASEKQTPRDTVKLLLYLSTVIGMKTALFCAILSICTAVG